MNHLGLFEGIGGFSLAASWMNWETVAWCEINPFCQKVLSKHFPEAQGHSDITKTDFTKYANRIDILTGGFPCQTFSVAGKGTTDLTLWKEMFRAITEIKPTFVVAENVPGIVGRKGAMAFKTVCTDLENFGYEVQVVNIPIAGKGAPHKRERIWFIAYSDKFRCDNEQEKHRQAIYNQEWDNTIEKQSGRQFQCRVSKSDCSITNTQGIGQKQSRVSRERGTGFENDNFSSTNTGSVNEWHIQREPGKKPKEQPIITNDSWSEQWYEVATRLCRVDDGISEGLDEITGIPTKPKNKTSASRTHRLMALGNALSPNVAFEIFRSIQDVINNVYSK